MKTKKLLPIALVLLFAISFSACKKRYPDGPLISLRSPMERICQKWKIWGFYVNGVNYTDSLSSIASITFKKEDPNSVNGPHTSNMYYINLKPPLDTLKYGIGGAFSLEDKQKTLWESILFPNNCPNSIKLLYSDAISFGGNWKNVTFEIKKLRNNAMVLERDVNGSHYHLELKPY